MSQPWGLSGPQFLVIYGVGTAVAVVVPFLLRLLIRVGSSAQLTSFMARGQAMRRALLAPCRLSKAGLWWNR